jgi:hypothetical protein
VAVVEAGNRARVAFALLGAVLATAARRDEEEERNTDGLHVVSSGPIVAPFGGAGSKPGHDGA